MWTAMGKRGRNGDWMITMNMMHSRKASHDHPEGGIGGLPIYPGVHIVGLVRMQEIVYH